VVVIMVGIVGMRVHDVTAVEMVGEGMVRFLLFVVGHAMAFLSNRKLSSRRRERRSIPLSLHAERVYFCCVWSSNNDHQWLDNFSERA
jgi:hypothetical protein